jgi:hypothetical protein
MGGGIDAQAQAHYNRVIADGGVVPAGVSGTNAFFNAVKTIYATSDITTAVSVGVDAHYLGYKLGAGSGATLGQAVQKLYSCAGSSGDVVQTTAASQPLLLAHNGASTDNYWYSPRVDGNYITTPNASANQITGDIEIIAKIKSNSSSIVQTILLKGVTSTYNYALDISIANTVRFVINGLNIYESTVTINPMTLQFIKVTRTSSNGDIKFFRSLDGVTYTQLGATISSPSGLILNNNYPVVIGGNTAYPGNDFSGNIYRLTIANSIGGTPVVDFNPASYNASTSQTQWTSTTGEVWTINTGTATTGYKGVLVDRTIVQSDGVDDRITSGTLASKTNYTRYLAITPLNTANQYVFAGSGAINHMNRKLTTNTFTVFNLPNEIILTSISALFKQLFTSDLNGSSSAIRVNGGTDTTGILGVSTSNSVTFGSDGLGSNPANTILQTVIETNSVDTNTTKTAMYNYIRSINNNAF